MNDTDHTQQNHQPEEDTSLDEGTQTETVEPSTPPAEVREPAPAHEIESLDLPALLLSLLFYKGEPETYKSLARVLQCEEADVRAAADTLSDRLQGTGLALVHDEATVELRTSAAASDMITALRKDELSRDLGNAGAETLAIVLYRSPVSRAEIDHIRGVNSSFILRALMMRGLVERIDDPANKRTYRYRPTTETLAHLGITDITNLPDHHVVSSELTAFFQSHQGS